jgi:hypothetical protein
MSTALPSARYLQRRGTQDGPDAATQETPINITQAQKEMLHAAIRIDQAGEVAANWIYKGQLAVLGRDPKSGPVIEVCISFTHEWSCSYDGIVVGNVGAGEEAFGRDGSTTDTA